MSHLPLVVRGVDDVERLLANSRHVRRLPASGPKVAIDRLDPGSAARLQASIKAYVGACGCAAGGAVALAALAFVVTAMATQLAHRGPQWADAAQALLGVLAAVLLGGAGKLLGMRVARWRFERSCRSVIDELSGGPAARQTGGHA